MKLYFFVAYYDGQIVIDEFGLELDNLDEAQAQAAALLPDIARAKLPDGEYHELICDVKDQCGRPVYRARLVYEGEQTPFTHEERSAWLQRGVAPIH